MERFVFVGSKRLGFECLRKIVRLQGCEVCGVVTFNDFQDERSELQLFVDYCESKKIPLVVARNREESELAIQQFLPDRCLVVGWDWYISIPILKLPSKGFFGIHNSLLPRYRGSAPLVWAMIEGEQEAGVTLHSYSGINGEGAVWGKERFGISDADYISDILVKVESAALGLLNRVWLPLLEGKLDSQQQKSSHSEVCRMRKVEDAKIDWSLSAGKVYDFIRAQSDPYPGAYCYNLLGEKLVVWRASLFEKKRGGFPGQLRLEGQRSFVVCGDRKWLELELLEGEMASFLPAMLPKDHIRLF